MNPRSSDGVSVNACTVHLGAWHHTKALGSSGNAVNASHWYIGILDCCYLLFFFFAFRRVLLDAT
jgi:hypothetical protein